MGQIATDHDETNTMFPRGLMHTTDEISWKNDYRQWKRPSQISIVSILERVGYTWVDVVRCWNLPHRFQIRDAAQKVTMLVFSAVAWLVWFLGGQTCGNQSDHMICWNEGSFGLPKTGQLERRIFQHVSVAHRDWTLTCRSCLCCTANTTIDLSFMLVSHRVNKNRPVVRVSVASRKLSWLLVDFMIFPAQGIGSRRVAGLGSDFGNHSIHDCHLIYSLDCRNKTREWKRGSARLQTASKWNEVVKRSTIRGT